MPLEIKQCIDRKVRSSDGQTATLSDALIDDQEWTVRYFVVRRGIWPFRKRRIILPKHIREIPPGEAEIPLSLSKEEIKSAPPVDAKAPVSRLKEKEFHDFYQAPLYWSGTAAWEQTYDPGAMPKSAGNAGQEKRETEQQLFENHLRSVATILGYSVKAEDEAVGRLGDIIVDPETWKAEGLVIERAEKPPRLWAPAKDIREISWIESLVRLDASTDLDEYRGV